MDRRRFLKILALAGITGSSALMGSCASSPDSPPPRQKQPFTGNRPQKKPILKPPRLRSGSTVGLVNPAGASLNPAVVDAICVKLAALGLKVKVGKHVMDRYGYLAGPDTARAADINAMFADPSVDAVLPVRGGWGCNRILPLLDYEVIGTNPKVLMGYSDITSLLVAIHERTGLVTFHGPVGISNWNAFTLEYVRRILFEGEAALMKSPAWQACSATEEMGGIRTITPGKARGRLVGGNLSVLTAMVGSEYLPHWNGHILFVEDIREAVYRVDRMITQLRLAGVLEAIEGFVFGKCVACGSGKKTGAFSLDEVLRDHLAPLNIPAWRGAPIGHVNDKLTVPVGVEAEIDATEGSIRLLEPAVV